MWFDTARRLAVTFRTILPALVVAAAVVGVACNDSATAAGDDATYVAGYCTAVKDLYAQRTTNWKSYVSDPSLTAPANVTAEVRQAWVAYADAVHKLNPPADLRQWQSEFAKALDEHVKTATTVSTLEIWVFSAPMPDSARPRLQPLADGVGCSLPFRVGF